MTNWWGATVCTSASMTSRSCDGARMPAATVGYLWETPLKPGERHIRRQVLGHRTLESLVITPRPPDGIEGFPGRVVATPRRRNPLRRFVGKHILRTARAEYDGTADALRRTLRDERVDLLHVFFGHKGADYSGALAGVPVPVTVSFHGADVGWCEHQADLRKRMPALFDTIACAMVRSEFMRRCVVDLGCPEDKTWVHRTGIPVGEYPVRHRERDPAGPVTFLQVGRMIPKKGMLDTIHAFAALSPQVPAARLWLAGDGAQQADLEAAVRERRLDDRVEFLGFLDPASLLRRLHEADVYVHPSVTTADGDREGIPNSMLEAMATGLAPITTRHAGIPEVVSDGVHGWLVDEGDREALAHRMAWCAGHPDEVAAAGGRARERVEELHDHDRRMEALEAKFGEILAKSRAGV